MLVFVFLIVPAAIGLLYADGARSLLIGWVVGVIASVAGLALSYAWDLPTGGTTAFGTATILDDGTGNIYPNNNTGNPDPNAIKDDDRPIHVNNINVNEGSPYAVSFDAEPPQQWNDGGHQRFADDDRRPLGLVEQDDANPGTREIGGQARADRTAAEDGHAAQGTGVHREVRRRHLY